MAVSPVIARILNQFGLSSLIPWASNAMIMGWSDDQLLLELYERPEFNNRFPAIKQLEAQGKLAPSPEQYIEYENTLRAAGRMWGMDVTQDEINRLITNGVSPAEAQERMNIVGAATYEAAPETRSSLERLYGISQGDFMHYWMDPKNTLGRLQQQFRTGQIAGAAMRTNKMQLTVQEAERLAGTGMSENQAVSSFGELMKMEELFHALSGNESEISQASQIEFLAGDTSVGKEVEKRASERKAEFAGGSGYGANEEGFAVGAAS